MKLALIYLGNVQSIYGLTYEMKLNIQHGLVFYIKKYNYNKAMMMTMLRGGRVMMRGKK